MWFCSAILTKAPSITPPMRTGSCWTPRTLTRSRMLSMPSISIEHCQGTCMISPERQPIVGTSSERYLVYNCNSLLLCLFHIKLGRHRDGTIFYIKRLLFYSKTLSTDHQLWSVIQLWWNGIYCSYVKGTFSEHDGLHSKGTYIVAMWHKITPK